MRKTNSKRAGKGTRTGHTATSKGRNRNLIRVADSSFRDSREIFKEREGQYKFNVDLLDSIFDAAIGY